MLNTTATTTTTNTHINRADRREAVRAEASHILAQLGDIEKPKDFRNFFRGFVFKEEGSAQLTASCMFCEKSITSTGVARLVDHLTVCFLCIPEVQEKAVALRSKTALKRKVKEQSQEIMEKELEIEAQLTKAKKQSMQQLGIRSAFSEAECQLADASIAKFFYANGVSFNAAGSGEADAIFRQMCDAIRKTPATYVPPSRKKLAGPLLDQIYEQVQSDLLRRDADGALAEKFGYTYTQDGWDSVDHLPLLNSGYICAGTGGVYLRSVDTSRAKKDAEYCAAVMISDIYTIGPLKVVAVVTDTCATMEKSWGIVKDEFPWISCMPCIPHVVSLMMKDVGKVKHVSDLIKDESTVVGWFTNHQLPLAVLRQKTFSILHKGCELVKAGATRFGTHTLVGERLQELKTSLQATVVDPQYLKENYKDRPDEEEFSNCESRKREHKGGTARKLVLDDDEKTGFWARIATHVAVTKPMYKLLRRFDSSAPTVGKVYSSFYELGQYLQSFSTTNVPYQQELLEAHSQRWAYGHVPFFAAAYALDPEFIGHDQMSNAEVSRGFNDTLEMIGILIEARRIQQETSGAAYKENWTARKQMIDKDKVAQGLWDQYPSYPTASTPAVKAFCKAVKTQYTFYKQKKGDYARDWILESAQSMPAYAWWEQNGGSTPQLQKFAMLVLAQPSSASLCERINSEFAFVKDRRRNRLDQDKANKLVSIFHNLRLLFALKKHEYVEAAVEWCDTEERSGIAKWGIANFE